MAERTQTTTAGREATVAEVMRRYFVTASPEETLPDVRQTMRMARLRHLVVARGDRLIGLLSYRRLLETLLDDRLDAETVAVAMIDHPVFVTADTPVAEAAERLCRYGFGCLPVVETVVEADQEEREAEPRVVGLLTETDLLRAAFRRERTGETAESTD